MGSIPSVFNNKLSVGSGSETEQLPTAKRLKDEKEPGEELTVKNRAKSKPQYAQRERSQVAKLY